MAHGALARIDTTTNSGVLVREGPIGAVAYGAGGLWALTRFENNAVERIDPRTHDAVESILLGRFGETTWTYGTRIDAGADAVWAMADSGKTVWKLDPAVGRIVGSVRLGRTPQGSAIDDAAVWVVSVDGTVLRIDPELGGQPTTIRLGAYPAAVPHPIAVGDGRVWVAVIR
jgi:streptogramin lyase